MNDLKKTIDKTEELVHKIWLAGLGAYGQGLDNVQEGYGKINDQTRQTFDELVTRGEKIEADVKSRLDTAKNTLGETSNKLKDATEKLKAKGGQLKDEALGLKITERLDEIRTKIASKITLPDLPEVPDFGQEKLLEELNKGLEEVTSTVTNLLKGAPKAAAEAVETAVKENPVAAKKPAAKKAPAAAKKPAAKKPAAKKPAAKKPAAKKPAAKKPAAKPAPAADKPAE